MSTESGTTEIMSLVEPNEIGRRTETLLGEHQRSIWRGADRMFAGLLVFEWMAGIVWALCRSPWTWDGAVRSIHPHVWQAVIFGAIIVLPAVYLVLAKPGSTISRHVIAISQMLSSALLIHISGGRIETHFHVFGSLAFLAFYRDWRVLITASVVVAADHLFRNFYMPESAYGVLTVSPWRWLEHAGWVVFEDLILIAGCVRGMKEMQGIASQRALLERSHELVEEKVKQRTEQLHQAQDDLVKVARQAGMADIATSVLHNVGNVLNSVNVSLQTATVKVQKSPVGQLVQAVGMMAEHKGDIGEFLERDQRGRLIPEFLGAVAETLSSEQAEVLEEMKLLAKNVEHIKEIVNVQQSHARVARPMAEVKLTEMTEDAIKVALVESESTKISVERDFVGAGAVFTDRHLALQILVNLISNAKHAMLGMESERRLVVRCGKRKRDGAAWAYVEVVDSGVGIETANLTRIFSHGYTTKKDGHGFGLHSSANHAKQLGGSLSAYSDGPGKGATFVLELPMRRETVSV